MDILQPVVALAIWTMVMWLWMYANRIPAMTAAKIDPDALSRDADASLDKLLPAQIQWKAHNYNHLHEAPTVFYAVAIVLALMQSGNGLAAILGWAYVALRIVHSLVQVTSNKIMVRFVIFNLSMLALLALIVLAAMAVF